MKKALGKLAAPNDLEHQIQLGGLTPLAVTIAHGIAAGQLPRHHDDPFDGMIIAQGAAVGLPEPRAAARAPVPGRRSTQ